MNEPFSKLIVEHFYVKFGDPSCISFLRYCVEKQTDSGKNPTPMIVVGVGKHVSCFLIKY